MKQFFLSTIIKRNYFLLILGLVLPFYGMTQSGSLNFNGVDSYVNLGNVSSLKPSSTFTIEAWVYLAAAPSVQANIISTGDDFPAKGYQLVVPNNLYPMFVVDGYANACVSTIGISLNTWHHIAATYNASGDMKIYIDGALGQSKASDGVVSYGTEDVLIGDLSQQPFSSTYPWNGRLDEIRFWGVEKSQSEIQSALNCEFSGSMTGLNANYRFNETTGTTLNDATSNANHGTLVNLTFNANAAAGKVYPALSAGDITGNQNICLGSSTTLTAAASGGGGTKTYTWISNNGNISVSGAASTTSAVADVVGSSNIRYVVSETGCLGALSNNYAVTALELPTVTTPNTSTYGSSACLHDANLFGITGSYSGGAGGGNFHWTSSNPSVVTIAGSATTGVMTKIGAGTSNISYYYLDANGCQSPTSSQTTITVNETPNAPTFASHYSDVYDDAFHLGNVTVGSGQSVTWYDQASAGSITSGIKNVGTATFYAQARIDATGCESSTRTAADVTITAKELTVNVSANNKEYDGNDAATLSTASFNGVIGGDDVTIGGTVTATFNDKTVANGKAITLIGNYTKSGTDAGNYYITQPTGLTANITPATLTVIVSANNKEYDGTDEATLTSASFNGIIGSDDVIIGGTVTANFDDKTAANGKPITLTGSYTKSGTDAGNYSITQPTGLTANITTKELTVSVSANNKQYDGIATATLGSASFNGIIGSDDVTIGGTVTAEFNNKNVGNGKAITLTGSYTKSGTDAGNYHITQPSGLTANITEKDLNISVTAQNKVYDGNDVATLNSASLSNLIGGDDVTLAGTVTANFNNIFVGNTKPVSLTGTYTISGTDAGNYNLIQPSGLTANITPKDLYITADNQAKCQGAGVTLNGTEFSVSGIISPDEVTSVTLTSAGTSAGTAASSTTYSIAPSAAVGSGLSNYTIHYNNGEFLVRSNPIASFSFNDNSQCFVGHGFNLTNTSSNGATTGSGTINDWSWTATGSSNAAFTGAGPHGPLTYSTHGDYTINLTVTDNYGCTNSTNFTNNVRVFEHPTASFTTSESSGSANNDFNICTGATVNFDGTGSTYGFGASSLTYQWRRDNANATGTGSTSATYSPAVNAVNNPDAITFALRVTDNNGCTSNDFATEPTQVINVYPYATPSLTTPDIGAQGQYGSIGLNGNGGQLICNGAAVFSGSATIPSGSVVSYVFNYGDGSGLETVSDPTLIKHTYPTVTNVPWGTPGEPNVRYTIQMTAITDQGCSTSTSISRDIKTGPDASIGLTDPSTQSVTNNSFEFIFGNTDRHPSYQISNLWTFGDGTSTTASYLTITPKVYTTAGNFRAHLIIYTNTGCTDTAYYDVVVTPAPAASFSVTPNACSNRDVNFNSGASVGATTYAWNFGDGNTSTLANPTHTYAADGNYTVTLTINGGVSSTNQSVSVITNPIAGSISSSINSCTNEYTFTSNATGTNLTYAWTFSGGSGSASTSSTAQRTYATADPTTVDLTVTANGACSTNVSQLAFTPVAEIAGPNAGLSASLVSACSTSVTINNTSTHANEFEYKVDGGTYTAQTTFPFNIDNLTPGIHTIYLKASDNGLCPDEASVNVTVAPALAGFYSNPPACGKTLSFTNTSSISYGTATYSWDFNSGEGSSNLENPEFTFATGGNKPVSLTVTTVSGCTIGLTAGVDVSTLTGPTASFSHAAAAGCGNGRIFTNTTIGSGLSFTWNFGDNTNTNVENPTKYFAASGNHQVTLTVSDGVCNSSTTQTVNIGSFNGNAASFEEGSGNYSQSLTGNSFNFSNTTVSSSTTWTPSYHWNFGDGTTSTNTHIFSKSYASAGTYTVTLTAVSSLGCSTTFARNIVISAANSANFSYTPNTCGSTDITFNSSTSVGASTYSWNFGDGNTSTQGNPTHTYAAPGSYNVVLTINGSIVSAPQTVVVSSAPTGVSITPSINACNTTYTYTAAATGSNLTYLWAFTNINGSAATLTNSTVTKSYSAVGIENVTLTVYSGSCSTTVSLNGYAVDEAGPLVSANLVVTAADACSGIRTINNTGSVGASFAVSIDGGSYTAQSTFPYDITALSAGVHTIALKAINGSCEDIDEVTITIGSVTAAFTATPSSCNQNVAFLNTSTATFGTPTYAWTFTDASPGLSTSTNPSTTYNTSGLNSATLVATLSNGCSTSVTNNSINVSSGTGPIPSFTSSFINTSACSTGYVFTSTSTGATNYTWDFGDGVDNINTANTSIFHTYATTGNFTVTLTARNSGGCSNSVSNSINVSTVGQQVPDASISLAFGVNASQCITGNTFYFDNGSIVNAPQWMPSHAWDFGDGTTSTQTHIHFKKEYAAPGTYTVTLTSTAINGCSGTASFLVTVNPTPCAGMSKTDEPGYYNGSDQFDGIGTNATGLNNSTLENELNLYPNPNTGNFKLSFGKISDKNAKIVIIDVTGREVYVENRNITAQSELELSDLNLAGGKYTMMYIGSNNQMIHKSFAVIK